MSVLNSNKVIVNNEKNIRKLKIYEYKIKNNSWCIDSHASLKYIQIWSLYINDWFQCNFMAFGIQPICTLIVIKHVYLTLLKIIA